MQVARIVAVSAIMLVAPVLSGCAIGTGRMRRESAEPLPGRLIEPVEPSVAAPAGSGQAWWKGPLVSVAAQSNSSHPQLAADSVLAPGKSNTTPRRRWFQGWTMAPSEITANFKANLSNPTVPSVASGGAGNAGHRQSTPAVTQTRATIDAAVLPNVPTSDALKSPVVRASRLAAKPVESLPVSIALRLPPRADEEDRLVSHEAPLADIKAEPVDVTPRVRKRPELDPPPAEEPSRLAAAMKEKDFPDPIMPPDLDDLDRILERTQNGEAVPTVAQEVPPDPDMDERFQGRRRLSTLPPPGTTTTLTMKGTGTRPVGLPAKLPDPTYPEDRTRYGTMMGRAPEPEPAMSQTPANTGTPTRRRGVLYGVADAISGLMRREPGNIAESR
ncbi:MAG: hypothetical protein U0800_01425 [Isosphaeraceae bacterium]